MFSPEWAMVLPKKKMCKIHINFFSKSVDGCFEIMLYLPCKLMR